MTDVVGVKVLVSTMLVSRGCAMRRSLLQGVGLRDGLVVPVAGVVVASMGVCLQGMSSCDESLSGGVFLYTRL